MPLPKACSLFGNAAAAPRPQVILSTFITGSIFAIFGGQPLCIVGVTGPVTIFTIACYKLADGMDLPFIYFYTWVQIWAALFHVILAISNACEMIKMVTRYSCETFGMLIAIIVSHAARFRRAPPASSVAPPARTPGRPC